MARPVKWSRDLHPIRDRAKGTRTETFGRSDIEDLFNVSRVSAQNLMKAIGEVQPVGGAHFIERHSLLNFLDAMIAAESVDLAYRARLMAAAPMPRSVPLRVTLPNDLRSKLLRDLPENIRLEPGRFEITASSTVGLVEALAAFAQILQQDLAAVEYAFAPPRQQPDVDDSELKTLFVSLRAREESRGSQADEDIIK